MKSIKEKQMLVKWAKAMNEPIDPALLEEVEKYERMLESVKKSVRSNLAEDLKLAAAIAPIVPTIVIEPQTAPEPSLVEVVVPNYELPPTLDEVMALLEETVDQVAEEVIKEEPQIVLDNNESIIHQVVSKIAEEEVKNKDSFQQPNPAPVDKNLTDIQKKLKFLEQAIGKIAATGPGGGAVWLRDLNDVNYNAVKNAIDGDVLAYNAANAKWEATIVTGGGTIPTLHQVTNRGNVTTNGITVNNANVDWLAINTSASHDVTTGEIAWNNADLTFNMGMANGVVLQVGQELYIKIKAANAITNGKTVMFVGADGEHILGSHCDTRSPGFRPEFFIGVATQDISKNGFGYVTTFGKVHNVNTLAFAAGNVLFADPTVVGGLTTTEPQAPDINIMVAAVTKRAGGDGHLMVRPSARSKLSELNDVAFNGTTQGQALVFDGGNVWRNQWLTTANVVELNNLYFTNARAVSAVTDTTLSNITVSNITIADNITLPNNSLDTGSDPITVQSTDTTTVYWRSPTGGGPGSIFDSSIRTDTDGVTITLTTGTQFIRDGIKTWNFSHNGNLTFPDSSVQTVAYSNTAVYSNVIQLGYITSSALSGYATNTQLLSYATVSNVALKANVVDLTTANVTEVTNLYFTNARATTAVVNATLSNVTVSGNVVVGNVNSSGKVTANATTAFVAGTAAESGVALEMPREGALRNMTNGSNYMYFDVSNGGTSDGGFRFRSSSSFTELLDISTSGLRATSAYKAKQFNGALDAEVSSDNLKFRVSNQGGKFPQIGSTTGSNVDVSWTIQGYVAGSGTLGEQNQGVLINSYTSLFTAHGLDTRGDMVVATIVDKNAEKIYRVTFIVSNNAGNTTGYSIIVERIL